MSHSPRFHLLVVRSTIVSFIIALVFGTLEVLPAVAAIPLFLYLASVFGLPLWAAVVLAAVAAALLRGAINLVLDFVIRRPPPPPAVFAESLELDPGDHGDYGFIQRGVGSC
jgi:hypothetical protein